MTSFKYAPGAFSAQFGGMRDELTRDFKLAFERAMTSQEVSDRRAAVRAAFADLESVLFMMRQLALARTDVYREFSRGELALLHEESYSLDASGEVRIRPSFARLEDALPFTLRMLARGCPTAYSLDKSGRGWQALQSAIRIRHRVTHPKRPDDIEISEDQLATVREAWQWTHDVITYSMAGVIADLRNEKDRLHSDLRSLAGLPADASDEGQSKKN